MSKTTLIYGDFAPGASNNAKFSGTNYEDVSNLTELRNDHDQVNILSLEQNLWILGGTYDFIDGQTIPFWSFLSDKNCVLSPQPTITVDFTNQYSSVGITLQFDELPGGYCSDLNIKWYRDGQLLSNMDFHPSKSNAFCENRVELYNKLVITFRKTNLPEQRIRLKQIVFGFIRRISMDEIRSARITNQMNHISTEVPVSTLEWTLDSKGGVEFMFQFKQPVEVKNDGFTIGVYYVTESRRTSESVYTVRCQDALGLLDDDTFRGGVYVGYSAKKLFSEIVNGDFVIDFGTVPDVLLTGVLQEMTKRSALQQVLFGWGVCAATDGGESIRLFELENVPKVIGIDRTYNGVAVETSAAITAVKLTAHDYKEDPDGSIEINGKKYSDTQTLYTINNPDVTGSTKANAIKIEGANFVNTGNAQKIAQRVYDYYMKRDTASVKLVWKGELLGDCITVPDAWNGTHTGNIDQMDITLSNTVAADTDVISG